MTNSNPTPGQRNPLRCSHCGRNVRETQHTRSAYQVDYYSMHTGPVELAKLASDSEKGAVTYQKLLSAIEIITCADCYNDTAVQNEREHQFHLEADGTALGAD